MIQLRQTKDNLGSTKRYYLIDKIALKNGKTRH